MVRNIVPVTNQIYMINYAQDVFSFIRPKWRSFFGEKTEANRLKMIIDWWKARRNERHMTGCNIFGWLTILYLRRFLLPGWSRHQCFHPDPKNSQMILLITDRMNVYTPYFYNH